MCQPWEGQALSKPVEEKFEELRMIHVLIMMMTKIMVMVRLWKTTNQHFAKASINLIQNINTTPIPYDWYLRKNHQTELKLPDKMNSFNFRAYLQIDGQTYVPIRNNWILISFSLTYSSFDFNIINGKEEKIRCAHHQKQRKVFKRHLCTK